MVGWGISLQLNLIGDFGFGFMIECDFGDEGMM
jgi:hypothetical protein